MTAFVKNKVQIVCSDRYYFMTFVTQLQLKSLAMFLIYALASVAPVVTRLYPPATKRWIHIIHRKYDQEPR